MSLNTALEIVITLAAVFWLLAMVASFSLEAINSLLLNVRATALERFAAEMVLGDGRVQATYSRLRGRIAGSPSGDPLGLLSHALIKSLRKPKVRGGGEGTPPSYIPSTVFAQALLDRVAALAEATVFDVAQVDALLADIRGTPAANPGGAWEGLQSFSVAAGNPAPAFALCRALFEPLGAITPSQAMVAIAPLKQALGQRSSPLASFLLLLLDAAAQAIKEAQQALPRHAAEPALATLLEPAALWVLAMRRMGARMPENMNLLDAVRVVVAHAPLPTALCDALRPIVAGANFSLDAVRSGVERWFDDVMDRASGWFKRYTTLWLGVIGFLLAIGLNINPIRLAQDLAQDPALRQGGVAWAQQIVQSKDGTVPQQLIFARGAESGRWERRLQAAESAVSLPQPMPLDALGQVQSLALELQPLLLRHGEFAGLLPTLARPLSAEAAKWTDSDGYTAFEAALCRADGDARGKATTQVACKTLMEAGKADRNQAARVFWSNSDWVWNPALALALWDALHSLMPPARIAPAAAAAAPDAVAGASPADYRTTLQALKTLRTAFVKATQQASADAGQARELLDRLPSAGLDALKWPERKSASWLDHAILVAAWGLITVVGWLITALMVSFGAPFWFDLLSALVNRRTTGPKPEVEPK
jgi:hypothetical protein